VAHDKSDDKLAIYRSGEVAASYDRRWRGSSGRARDQRKQRALGRALEHFDGARSVLDVPCGTGRFHDLFASRGWRYCGADAASAMLTVAREKCGTSNWIAGDLTRLPFADRSFDLALCIRLMHLVRDERLREAFLAELARVSRIGVIVDYRQDQALRVWLGNARAKLGLRAKRPGALPLEHIRREVESSGLAVREFVPVRRVPYLSDKIVVVALHRATPSAPAPRP